MLLLAVLALVKAFAADVTQRHISDSRRARRNIPPLLAIEDAAKNHRFPEHGTARERIQAKERKWRRGP